MSGVMICQKRSRSRWQRSGGYDAMGDIVNSLTFQPAFESRRLDLSMTTLAQMEVDRENYFFVRVDLAAVQQAVLDLRRYAKSTDP